MPRWVLRCPSCNKDFMHSKIETTTLKDFFFEKKPDFPVSNCHSTNTYQRRELTYRKDGDA